MSEPNNFFKPAIDAAPLYMSKIEGINLNEKEYQP